MKKLALRILLLSTLTLAFASTASACGRDLLKTYYGFYDTNNIPRCGVVISPQPTYTLVVGQEYWDCNAQYSQWGLICTAFYDTERAPCGCGVQAELETKPALTPDAKAGEPGEPGPWISIAKNGEVCSE